MRVLSAFGQALAQQAWWEEGKAAMQPTSSRGPPMPSSAKGLPRRGHRFPLQETPGRRNQKELLVSRQHKWHLRSFCC